LLPEILSQVILLASLLRPHKSALKSRQPRQNKALHPTAYSLRFGRSSRRSGFRRRVSLVVLPSRAAWFFVILTNEFD
jgi:hypothetical protein